MRRDSKIEMQNIPIPLTEEQRKTAKAIKRAFFPEGDRVLCETDFASIEIRLAALYGLNPGLFK